MASSPRQDRVTSQPLHSFKQQNSPAGHKKNRSWLQKMRSPKGTAPVGGSRFFFSLCLGILSTALSAIPAFSAERIAFFYPPFGEFYISIKDLEIFAKEGKITPEFAFYANRVKPRQLAVLRELLQRRLDVGPVTISQFTYTPIGKQILRRLGQVLKADFNQNGFYALRSAFVQAAADPEGLTLVNILHQFPLRTIRLDLQLSLRAIREVSYLFGRRDLIVNSIQQQAADEVATTTLTSLPQPDLRVSGQFRWRKETITFNNPNRELPVPADIYLPQGLQTAPVIVISHGVASDRNTFAYLAEHLASWGFAVALVEHPDTSAEKFQRFLTGFDTPPQPTTFINRPLDVKYLLDELQQKSESDPAWKGRLNVQQVGVIGQSLGGYTVLALGGAALNFEKLRQVCNQSELNNTSFNLSLLLQCRSTDLPPQNYNLQDERVKAVLAVNPLSSTIFGQEGLSKIQVPVMLVAGVEDLFTPPVPEQIFPFTWLTTRQKYLVMAQNATHFSYLGGKKGVLPVPPELIGSDPALARPQLRALSTAFFKTHLSNQPEYRPYLSQPYVKAISQNPFNLTLIKSLTATQLEQAIAGFR